MTDKPTPTDGELKAMWQLHAADIVGIFDFARAVLAKWGQPAQAAEPVAYLTRNADGDPAMLFFDKDEASTYCEDWVDPAPLFTAPQPVAREPLSEQDPLQGAANWLVTAHAELTASTLACKLSIGYNRAKRPHDAALAAQGGKA